MLQNRSAAGRKLAALLRGYAKADPVVLALPRGGVVVGAEIAAALYAPLDIVVVRKLGAPGQPELAIGAVVGAEQPEVVLNEETVALFDVSRAYLDHEVAAEIEEIRRREARYRDGRPRVAINGRTAIVVDDGIATGASIRAALRAIRRAEPAHLVLAVPVAPMQTLESLRGEVDELVYLEAPELFGAVGLHYQDFAQTSDEEVIALLARYADGAAM
jgi:putative phosphoribosyl transferase